MLLPLLLVMAPLVANLIGASLGIVAWPGVYISLIVVVIFLVGSVIMLEKHEKQEALDYIKKLKRFAEDFHDLALKSVPQHEDMRIHRIMDCVPYHAKAAEAGVAVPVDEIHLHKRLVQNSLDLVDGWFDDYSKRLDLFAQNPGLLDTKNLVDILRGFKRLVFEYYTRVVDESIDFTNKASVAHKEARLIFNAFKDRYNQFAEKLRTFLKDLKEGGYDAGDGWAVASVSKELEIRVPT